MPSFKLLRDVALAVALALPTIALTRPVASDAQEPQGVATPVIEQAAIAELTISERRVQIPLD